MYKKEKKHTIIDIGDQVYLLDGGFSARFFGGRNVIPTCAVVESASLTSPASGSSMSAAGVIGVDGPATVGVTVGSVAAVVVGSAMNGSIARV